MTPSPSTSQSERERQLKAREAFLKGRLSIHQLSRCGPHGTSLPCERCVADAKATFPIITSKPREVRMGSEATYRVVDGVLEVRDGRQWRESECTLDQIISDGHAAQLLRDFPSIEETSDE